MNLRRLSSRAALALVVAGLSACATVEPVRRVDTSAACAASPDELVAHPALPPPEGETAKQRKARARVQFADLAGCLDWQGTRQAAALFRVDAVPSPSQVQVRITSDSRGILAASATLLDEAYQPMAVHGFDRFTRRGGLYSLDIFIDAGEPEPTYLLLSPDPGRVGGVDTHVGSAVDTVIFPTGGAYNHGYENTVARPLGEGGFVTVEVHPQVQAPLAAD